MKDHPWHAHGKPSKRHPHAETIPNRSQNVALERLVRRTTPLVEGLGKEQFPFLVVRLVGDASIRQLTAHHLSLETSANVWYMPTGLILGTLLSHSSTGVPQLAERLRQNLPPAASETQTITATRLSTRGHLRQYIVRASCKNTPETDAEVVHVRETLHGGGLVRQDNHVRSIPIAFVKREFPAQEIAPLNLTCEPVAVMHRREDAAVCITPIFNPDLQQVLGAE